MERRRRRWLGLARPAARPGLAAVSMGIALIGSAIGLGARHSLAQDEAATPRASPISNSLTSLLATSQASSEPEIAARLAHLHDGTCAAGELGEIVESLSDVTRPEGDAVGQPAAITAQTSFSNVPISLDELLAADYAIDIHQSDAATAENLACGEIGGALEETGALQIGLKAVGGSGVVGIAYLGTDPNDGSTDISIFVADGLVGSGIAGTTSPRPFATVEVPDTESTEKPTSDEGPEATERSTAIAGGVGTRSPLDASTASPVASGDAVVPDSDATATATATATVEVENVEVVLVSLREFEIDMPSTLAAGRTTFSVSNDGSVAHGFVISGEGMEERLSGRLQAGESGTLTVDLTPGDYEIICPVGNHADQGMVLEISVE